MRLLNLPAKCLKNIIYLLIEIINSLKTVKSRLDFSVLLVNKPIILTVCYLVLRIVIPFLCILLIKVWKFMISIYLLKNCPTGEHYSYIVLIFLPISFCMPELEPGIIPEKDFLDIVAKGIMMSVFDERYNLHITKGLIIERAIENALKEFQLLLVEYIKKSIRYVNQDEEPLVFKKTSKSHNFGRLQNVLNHHRIPSDLSHPLNNTSTPTYLVLQTDLKTPNQLITAISHSKVSPVYFYGNTVEEKIIIAKEEAEKRFTNAVLWSDSFVLTKPGILGTPHNGMGLTKVFSKRIN